MFDLPKVAPNSLGVVGAGVKSALDAPGEDR